MCMTQCNVSPDPSAPEFCPIKKFLYIHIAIYSLTNGIIV